MLDLYIPDFEPQYMALLAAFEPTATVTTQVQLLRQQHGLTTSPAVMGLYDDCANNFTVTQLLALLAEHLEGGLTHAVVVTGDSDRYSAYAESSQVLIQSVVTGQTLAAWEAQWIQLELLRMTDEFHGSVTVPINRLRDRNGLLRRGQRSDGRYDCDALAAAGVVVCAVRGGRTGDSAQSVPCTRAASVSSACARSRARATGVPCACTCARTDTRPLALSVPHALRRPARAVQDAQVRAPPAVRVSATTVAAGRVCTASVYIAAVEPSAVSERIVVPTTEYVVNNRLYVVPIRPRTIEFIRYSSDCTFFSSIRLRLDSSLTALIRGMVNRPY